MQQTQAAISDTQGNFSIQTIDVGKPGPGEVAVDIKASGICHTDYDSMNWDQRVVMGHEGAGIVTAIGDGVTTCDVGDKVLLNWAIPCMACPMCVRGHQNLCMTQNTVTAADPANCAAHPESTQLDGQPIYRSFAVGTMSAHTVVKEAAIIPIHVDIPWDSACIVGCGVMTGYGSAVNSGKVKAGDNTVVIGCGGVGLNAIQGCRIAGAGKVIAIDLSETRLEMAKQFGATHTIQAQRDDKGLLKAAEQVAQLCGGIGADVAVEATAVPALGAAPLAMVRSGGTAVQASGIEQEITIDMNLFEWDKVYINPLYGGCRPTIDLPILLDLYAKGELLLDEMISKQYALGDLGQAFDDMHHGRIAKGVIMFD
ncbi:Zn-dependent alcohol dehydrogenase [Algisphaera agarilytica]|uniref:S-(Hydroxymethyl)glutathione dehydrogenase/alcohol dehydrogenase n=1 Tax=Algisphaera agarilytica TaxID=1385975 RepID=A0A7X0H5M8_9BACT|nr:Zn-dependent alcohol dehydrogenase [Algisphaera agarilytica]MBB6429731.1 S-(hydroxymethyl)glutathione dehydrogenase/alcohol dehydrogenase [Algisphaera agarilytica]